MRKRDVSGAGRLPRTLEEALPDAAVRRFLLRAGFRSSSDRAAAEVRRHVSDFFRRIVGCMVVMMQHDGRRSFRLVDVKRACEHFGIRMYGYDDMCLLAAGRASGPEAFHVTELVECNSFYSRSVDTPEEPDTEPGARYKKTDFVANYTSWRDEMGDAGDDMSDSSEWAFSDSDSNSEGGHDMDMETSQPWQPDEEKFLGSLRDAQELRTRSCCSSRRMRRPTRTNRVRGTTRTTTTATSLSIRRNSLSRRKMKMPSGTRMATFTFSRATRTATLPSCRNSVAAPTCTSSRVRNSCASSARCSTFR